MIDSVPFFPKEGPWKLDFYVWDSRLIFLEKNFNLFRVEFTVGESTFLQQLTAPFYFHWGGMEWTGWGAFGFKIPCFLLLITIPIWIIIVMLIVRLWIVYARIGKKEFRKIIPKLFRINLFLFSFY